MQSTLDKLARKYKTDKCTLKCTGMVPKGYTVQYEQVFQHLRNEQITLLEIGVNFGASILMWMEYFKNGRIVGIDNRQECLDLAMLKAREFRSGLSDCATLELHLGDQGVFVFMDYIRETYQGQLDIIIDDGSHKPIDINLSLMTLEPALKTNGYYCIEDLHAGFNTQLKRFVEFCKERNLKTVVNTKSLLILQKV